MTEIFDDIRQIYRFSLPCAELKDCIEFFSESADSQPSAFDIKMFPSWTPTIWLNLGRPYHLTIGSATHAIGAGQDILVLRDGGVTRHNQPADRIFTIKFFPGALGIHQHHFIGRVIDASDIIPTKLIAQVKVAKDFDARKALLEAYFLTSLRRHEDHFAHLVRESIGIYGSTGMTLNTSQLAERMFISSKTINRYFNNVVGVPPKKYFSIARARTALTAFVGGRPDFDPAAFGYYDMSHFYREAVSFTGQRMRT